MLQTSAGTFAQNETEWTPWLRTLAGVRVDGYRFGVDAGIRANAGTELRRPRQPEGRRASSGRSRKTELYVNAGLGFHSNDARGATITIDPVTGEPAKRVTPLARATGAEVGVRTRAHSTPADDASPRWTLGLDSELVFVGDAGTTDAGRPSRRQGIEWTNYYSPRPWLMFDADVALVARALHRRRSGGRPHPRRGGDGRVRRRDGRHRAQRLRQRALALFRARARSSKTTPSARRPRASSTSPRDTSSPNRCASRSMSSISSTRAHSDIDYFYTSRLPGEPAGGIDDIHMHPAAPRTARVNVIIGF